MYGPGGDILTSPTGWDGIVSGYMGGLDLLLAGLATGDWVA
jgi:hypothetical protein